MESTVDVWKKEDDDRNFNDIYGDGVSEEDVINASAAAARGDLTILRASAPTITRTLAKIPLLHLSAEASFLTLSYFLLRERGCGVNDRADDGTTALHVACGRFGSDRIVAMLLSEGGNPLLRDRDGWSALHYAARYGRVGTVWMLLKCGAPLLLEEADGRTPKDIAKRFKRFTLEAMLDDLEDLTRPKGGGREGTPAGDRWASHGSSQKASHSPGNGSRPGSAGPGRSVMTVGEAVDEVFGEDPAVADAREQLAHYKPGQVVVAPAAVAVAAAGVAAAVSAQAAALAAAAAAGSGGSRSRRPSFTPGAAADSGPFDLSSGYIGTANFVSDRVASTPTGLRTPNGGSRTLLGSPVESSGEKDPLDAADPDFLTTLRPAIEKPGKATQGGGAGWQTSLKGPMHAPVVYALDDSTVACKGYEHVLLPRLKANLEASVVCRPATRRDVNDFLASVLAGPPGAPATRDRSADVVLLAQCVALDFGSSSALGEDLAAQLRRRKFPGIVVLRTALSDEAKDFASVVAAGTVDACLGKDAKLEAVAAALSAAVEAKQRAAAHEKAKAKLPAAAPLFFEGGLEAVTSGFADAVLQNKLRLPDTPKEAKLESTRFHPQKLWSAIFSARAEGGGARESSARGEGAGSEDGLEVGGEIFFNDSCDKKGCDGGGGSSTVSVGSPSVADYFSDLDSARSSLDGGDDRALMAAAAAAMEARLQVERRQARELMAFRKVVQQAYPRLPPALQKRLLSTEFLRECAARFDVLDTVKAGYLTMSQMTSAVASLLLDGDNSAVRLDEDDEDVNMTGSFNATAKGGHRLPSEAVVRSFDANADGKISCAEFVPVLRHMVVVAFLARRGGQRHLARQEAPELLRVLVETAAADDVRLAAEAMAAAKAQAQLLLDEAEEAAAVAARGEDAESKFRAPLSPLGRGRVARQSLDHPSLAPTPRPGAHTPRGARSSTTPRGVSGGGRTPREGGGQSSRRGSSDRQSLNGPVAPSPRGSAAPSPRRSTSPSPMGSALPSSERGVVRKVFSFDEDQPSPGRAAATPNSRAPALPAHASRRSSREVSAEQRGSSSRSPARPSIAGHGFPSPAQGSPLHRNVSSRDLLRAGAAAWPEPRSAGGSAAGQGGSQAPVRTSDGPGQFLSRASSFRGQEPSPSKSASGKSSARSFGQGQSSSALSPERSDGFGLSPARSPARSQARSPARSPALTTLQPRPPARFEGARAAVVEAAANLSDERKARSLRLMLASPALEGQVSAAFDGTRAAMGAPPASPSSAASAAAAAAGTAAAAERFCVPFKVAAGALAAVMGELPEDPLLAKCIDVVYASSHGMIGRDGSLEMAGTHAAAQALDREHAVELRARATENAEALRLSERLALRFADMACDFDGATTGTEQRPANEGTDAAASLQTSPSVGTPLPLASSTFTKTSLRASPHLPQPKLGRKLEAQKPCDGLSRGAFGAFLRCAVAACIAVLDHKRTRHDDVLAAATVAASFEPRPPMRAPWATSATAAAAAAAVTTAPGATRSGGAHLRRFPGPRPKSLAAPSAAPGTGAPGAAAPGAAAGPSVQTAQVRLNDLTAGPKSPPAASPVASDWSVSYLVDALSFDFGSPDKSSPCGRIVRCMAAEGAGWSIANVGSLGLPPCLGLFLGSLEFVKACVARFNQMNKDGNAVLTYEEIVGVGCFRLLHSVVPHLAPLLGGDPKLPSALPSTSAPNTDAGADKALNALEADDDDNDDEKGNTKDKDLVSAVTSAAGDVCSVSTPAIDTAAVLIEDAWDAADAEVLCRFAWRTLGRPFHDEVPAASFPGLVCAACAFVYHLNLPRAQTAEKAIKRARAERAGLAGALAQLPVHLRGWLLGTAFVGWCGEKWAALDVNGSGTLEVDELRPFLRALGGVSFLAPEVKRFRAIFASDPATGLLGRLEFSAFMTWAVVRVFKQQEADKAALEAAARAAKNVAKTFRTHRK